MKSGDILYCKKNYIRKNSYFRKGNFYKILNIVMKADEPNNAKYHSFWMNDHLNEGPIKAEYMKEFFCTKKELLNLKLKKIRGNPENPNT